MVGVPSHVPRSAVSVAPSRAVPEIAGATMLAGGADIAGRHSVGRAGRAGDVRAAAAVGVAAPPLVVVTERGRASPRAAVGGERGAVARRSRDGGRGAVGRAGGRDRGGRRRGRDRAAARVASGDGDAKSGPDVGRGQLVARGGGAREVGAGVAVGVAAPPVVVVVDR